LPRRSFLAALAAGSAALVAPAGTRAEDQDAAIASPQPIVAPLQPVPIAVRLAGYSGPAALVLFDAAGRYAGVAEGQIVNERLTRPRSASQRSGLCSV
jgi:hypothetical protein